MRGIVFDCDLYPKFFSLNAGINAASRYSERVPSRHLPSGGHREALWRGAGSRGVEARRLSRGTGRGEGQLTWTTRSSPDWGSRPARPISEARGGPSPTAGSLVPLFSPLLAARHPGRGATTPSAAAARPQA